MNPTTVLGQHAHHYRRASATLDVRRAALYKAIRIAYQAGTSMGAIAEATGLSKARVQQILEGVTRS